MAEQARDKSTRLTHAMYYQLVMWIASNGERLMKEKPLFAKVAEQAAKELGFSSVSVGTLREGMKQVGIDWQPSGATGTYARVTREDFDLLKQELTATATKLTTIGSELAVLRGLVHKLYQDLNATPPAGHVLPPKEKTVRLVPPSSDRIATGHQ